MRWAITNFGNSWGGNVWCWVSRSCVTYFGNCWRPIRICRTSVGIRWTITNFGNSRGGNVWSWVSGSCVTNFGDRWSGSVRISSTVSNFSDCRCGNVRWSVCRLSYRNFGRCCITYTWVSYLVQVTEWIRYWWWRRKSRKTSKYNEGKKRQSYLSNRR